MNYSKGFSLVELAVALAIIGLLLAGALIPLTTQIEVRNIADTQRTMDSIREAIIGFAQANGRLPCPARGQTPAGTVDTTTWPPPAAIAAGTEQWDTTTNRCYIQLGVIPWSTLGVPETDSWGRRFTYRVSPVFSDLAANLTWSTTFPQSPGNQPAPACNPNPTPGAPTSFALCSLGDIAVFTRGGTTTTAIPLGTALPAIIISHGKNGLGAWLTNGVSVTPVPVGDELANATGTTGSLPQPLPSPLPTGYFRSWIFYSRTPTPAAGGCVDPTPDTTSAAPACEFDDIVAMITINALIARMVAAGRLP